LKTYLLGRTLRGAAFPPVLTVIIILAISAFTHLWNPLGYPSVQTDEGTYMGRALMVLKGLGLHEAITTLKHEGISVFTRPYDHPFFGQLFLASALGVMGYPDSLSIKEHDVSSIKSLYLAPRILMGLIAVVDTFLVYEISQKRYNRSIAVIASILFAVMPITWLTRRIFLDNLLLPLLLTSILFAIFTRDLNVGAVNNKDNKWLLNNKKKRSIIVLISGIFLGLAIFTKIPVFTFIPLIGYLVFTSTNKSWKTLGQWIIPVISIPLIWPAYAVAIDDFDNWSKDFLWQASGRIERPLWLASDILLRMDPVLLVLGSIGIVFSIIKRDFFLALWVAPLLILLLILGYVSYWFFIPLLGAFAIGGALLIVRTVAIFRSQRIRKGLLMCIFTSISIFGVVSTVMIITTEMNNTFYQTVSSIVSQSFESKVADDDDKLIVIGNRWVPSFSWLLNFVYLRDVDYEKFYLEQSPQDTGKILMVVDKALLDFLRDENQDNKKGLQLMYDKTVIVEKIVDDRARFDTKQYPYTSMRENRPIGNIEIRATVSR
jgi:hypothetical protein